MAKTRTSKDKIETKISKRQDKGIDKTRKLQ